MESRPRLSATTIATKWNEKQQPAVANYQGIGGAADEQQQDGNRQLPISGKTTATAAASSRSRIAGYIVTKLSNLTNLGSSSTHNQQQHQSCSAPPSPLIKKRNSSGQQQTISSGQQLQQSILATPIRRPKSSSRKRAPKTAATDQAQQQPLADWQQQQPLFSISKDYGGCDFVLYLESSSSSLFGANSKLSGSQALSQSAAGGGGATSGTSSAAHGQQATAGQLGSSGTGAGSGTSSSLPTSGCSNWGGPLIIHLVAPNLQEKAAWMSDISQVSSSDPCFCTHTRATVVDQSISEPLEPSVNIDWRRRRRLLLGQRASGRWVVISMPLSRRTMLESWLRIRDEFALKNLQTHTPNDISFYIE